MKKKYLIFMVKFILFTLLIASCSTIPQKSLVSVKDVLQAPVPKIDEPFIDLNDYSLLKVDLRVLSEMNLFVNDFKLRSCRNKEYCSYIPKKSAQDLSYKKNFSYKDINNTQSLSFESNLNLLRKTKTQDLDKNYQKFLENSKCPRRTTAAVSQRLEVVNWQLSERLFNYAQECGIDKEYESLYTRHALVNYNQGKKEKAEDFIKKALEVKGLETPRILYWGFIILKDPAYIHQLKKEFPYSFHSVKYAEDNNEDLFKEISAKSWIVPERRDDFLNKMIEVLLKKDRHSDAYSLLNYNLDKLVKNDIKNLFYLMKLFAIHCRQDYTIRLVSKLGYKHPETLNTQLLSFSYNMAYLEKFKIYSNEEKDNYLFLSLSKQESGFYTKARSKANARGLMQLIPATAREMSKSNSKDLYNVDNNIELGTRYFYSLYKQYNSIEKALAAYNAGPGNVNKWTATYQANDPVLFMDTIPIKETRNYVSSILKYNYFYVKMAQEIKSPKFSNNFQVNKMENK